MNKQKKNPDVWTLHLRSDQTDLLLTILRFMQRDMEVKVSVLNERCMQRMSLLLARDRLKELENYLTDVTG